MTSHTPTGNRSQDDGQGGARGLRYWLDMFVKLTVPLSAIAVAYFADRFEAHSSALGLQNQREQSETNLRATMFGQLIGPIVGPAKDGQQAPDPLQYALLVKLLALNFHEHFEFGPLMQNADDRLVAGPKIRSDDVVAARRDLRSVAHRIIDRQVGALPRDVPPNGSASAAQQDEVGIWVFSDEFPEADQQLVAPPTDLKFRLASVANPSSQPVTVTSPGAEDQLTISFSRPDWNVEGVDAQIVATALNGANEVRTYQFRVTSFSFPLSDNTLLWDGNRFALFLTEPKLSAPSNAQQSALVIRLRWFPKWFNSASERPPRFVTPGLRTTLPVQVSP